MIFILDVQSVISAVKLCVFAGMLFVEIVTGPSVMPMLLIVMIIGIASTVMELERSGDRSKVNVRLFKI